MMKSMKKINLLYLCLSIGVRVRVKDKINCLMIVMAWIMMAELLLSKMAKITRKAIFQIVKHKTWMINYIIFGL